MYQHMNATNYVDALINRMDDELEVRGRKLAFQLLDDVLKENKTPQEAEEAFARHVQTTLENMGNERFASTLMTPQDRSEASAVAKYLLSQPTLFTKRPIPNVQSPSSSPDMPSSAKESKS